jgi:hypothetical protein
MAVIARSRKPWLVVMSGAFRSACACRRVSQFAGPDADRLRALHARDAGGPFRRQQPVVRRRDRRALMREAPPCS